MATHPSILAWKIPWAGPSGGPQSLGSRGVRLDIATQATEHTYPTLHPRAHTASFHRFSSAIYQVTFSWWNDKAMIKEKKKKTFSLN